MKKFLSWAKLQVKRMIIIFIRIFCPVKKNRIYFISNGGAFYSCNPRAFFEYLYENHKNEFEFCYCVKNELKNLLPKDKNIKTFKNNSIKNIYYFQTSKIIISNFRIGWAMNKRKGQFYIQTWHGGPIPQKMIEKDAINDLDSNYIKMAKKDSLNIDLLMTGSDAVLKIFKTNFWYNGNISNFGTPRYDVFIKTSKAQINEIKKRLGIKEQTKVVLYAPTFRDSVSLNNLLLKDEIVLNAFEKYFNENVVLIYKFHPNQINNAKNINFGNKKVINLTTYSNIVDLELIADVLITDFSSVMADFVVMNKLCFLLIKDYEDYINNERGLYLKLDDLPYLKVKKEEEFSDILKDENLIKNSLKKLTEFKEKYGINEVGDSCAKLYNVIKEKTNE